MYTWKYHKETPCSTFISNKLKCHVFVLSFSFFLLQNQRIEGQNKSCPGWRGWYQWDGGMVGKEGEGDYSAKNVYTYM
jgi:hypothetical protein